MVISHFDFSANLVRGILAIPLICAVLPFIFKRTLYRDLSIFITSFMSFVMTLYLILKFIETNSTFFNVSILSTEHFNILANIEPLNLIFLSIASFLWSITNLYSWSYLRVNTEINQNKFYAFLSIAIFCTFGIAFAADLITTFIFYELLTLSTYPLVANVGTDHEKKSSNKYVSILMFTSLVILLPAILIIMNSFGKCSYSIGGIIHHIASKELVTMLFIMCLYGVSKSAIIPVHFWLPEAMVAPIPVSAVLHAVAVVKSGIFIILKLIVYIFGITKLQSSILEIFHTNIITILCAASLLISSVFALYQKQIKKLLAYSTINQLSICLIAASMFHPIAIKASVLHMVSHALGKITMFFSAGYVYSKYKITAIQDFAGLGQKEKLVMAILTLASLSIIGVPIFAGFISKSYILFASIVDSINYCVIAILIISILATSHYFIKLVNIIYYQETTSDKPLISKDRCISMLVTIIVISLLTISYIFIYDHILSLLDRISYKKPINF